MANVMSCVLVWLGYLLIKYSQSLVGFKKCITETMICQRMSESSLLLAMFSGQDLLLVGPLFRKKCGGPYFMNIPFRLPSSDTHSSHYRHFVEDPCCNVHYYCSSSCLAVWGHAKSFPLFCNHYFNISGLLPCCKKMKKNCAFVGPPFCGAPVPANILNMPKSASECFTTTLSRTRVHNYWLASSSPAVCVHLSVCLCVSVFVWLCIRIRTELDG